MVGKNIRADLKKHFPKTKFSVRMRHYTSYYISWNDGPTVDNVDSILMKYKTGHFNSHEDYHYNEDTPFNVIYGGVDYVFTDRKYSDEKIEMTIQFLLKKHGEFYRFDTNFMTVENFRRGKLWNVGLDQVRGNNGIQGEIHRVLSEITY
nr:LPD29 domain-containing protein [Providencia alcalifaciens]